jgi:predicted alpha/beta-fold hydrolase
MLQFTTQVISDNNFHVGFNRVYDVNLANSLRRIYARHEHLFQGLGGEYNPTLAANCKTIREFDDAITRVSFGWPSVDAYYAGSGSAASVPNVAIPLLCIQVGPSVIFHSLFGCMIFLVGLSMALCCCSDFGFSQN